MRESEPLTGQSVTGQVLLTEYENLKKEQISRIRYRDSLLYATLAAAAAVLAATLNTRGQLSVLLALPVAAVILGWTYLANDATVSALGRYIRTELAPQLTTITGVSVFGWETAHRTHPGRRTRKALQLAVDLTTFSILPITTLVIFWAHGPRSVPLMAVSIAESMAVATLTTHIVLHAELQPDKPDM
jgi:hypothetical protein